ncbi:MAG: hypothetical protein K6U87_13165 [Firmicutes bacterium]|nr:hypothetical protein [Bacillota bacterium]
MAIPDAMLAAWIRRLAAIPGIAMDPDALVDDVVLTAYAFPQETDFSRAMVHVEHALALIVQQRNLGQALRGNLAGWRSYHFQSRRARRHSADLRIVYQDTGSEIRVRGFGHRWIPEAVYRRLYDR